MTILFDRPVNRRRLLGSSVVSLRSDGHRWWSAATATTGPAGNHYVHSVWGDTSKLTPPRALSNPAIITDMTRGKPQAGFFDDSFANGATVTGAWINYNTGRSTSHLLSPHGTQQVFKVTVDGNGGDVWWNGNNGALLDHRVHFTNCRTIRITGIEARIDDVRTISGCWPDDGSFTRDGEQLIHFDGSQIPDLMIFIEGCSFDMNHGGPGVNYQLKRTDIMSSSRLGDRDTLGSIAVIQNCRLLRVSSTTYADTHADVWHFQGGDSDRSSPANVDGGNYLDYLHIENSEVSSAYQTFQCNYLKYTGEELYKGKYYGRGAPALQRKHVQLYRARFEQFVNRAGFLAIGGSSSDVKKLPSVRVEDVYMALQENDRGFTSGGFYPNSLYTSTGLDKFPQPQWNPTYLNSRSNIQLWNGEVQAQAANVGGDNRIPSFFLFNNATAADLPVATFAPADKVGDGYVSLWDADGNLLAEA